MASHFLTRFTANDSQQRRHKVRKVLLEMLERRELLAADWMADIDQGLVSQLTSTAQNGNEITFSSSNPGLSGYDVTAYLDQTIGSGTASASLTDRPWFGLIEDSYQKWSQDNGLAFSFTGGLAAEGEDGGLVAEGEGQTALDLYVAAPDPSYSFNIISTTAGVGHTLYDLEMTSQTWRTVTEVNWSQWRHRMSIVIPDTVASSKSLLIIGGGSHSGTGGHGGAALQSAQLNAAVALAVSTGTVVSAISNVPYQPLRFEGESNNRSEDALIAKSYRNFLDGTDDQWPALLPMVKSAVRAMDTVQTVAQQQRGLTVSDFVVTGASKRGWTTWLTAAVDARVSAIAPQVINVLNMDEQMDHHRTVYEGVTTGIVGGYSAAVRDYVNEGIFDHFDDPRGKELLKIVDPYEYRDRLTMPKFMINATGDEFFVPDSDQFFFDSLRGQNHIRYVPNVGHGLGPDAAASLAQFYSAMVSGTSLPQFSWSVTPEGAIDVITVGNPAQVQLWQATNPDNRDFRQLYTSGTTTWTASNLSPASPGRYLATVPRPQSGHTAFMVELTYMVGGQPMKFTTEVSVMSAASSASGQFNDGPRLLSVAPNSGEIFSFNQLNTLKISPTELVLRFDDSIDVSNLGGIQLVGAGKDSVFGNGNDRTITPGWIGAGENDRIIIMRFTEPLEDDLYRVQLSATGDDAVRNLLGTFIATRAFDSTPGDRTVESVDFRLQLGTKVLGVVPQPVDRLANGTLNPRRDVIRVYFNNDDLHPTAVTTGQFAPNPSVVDPAYYQLIFTNDSVQPGDDQVFAPSSISYDPATDSAELTFASPIDQLVAGGGTFRLRVGSRASVNSSTNLPVITQIAEVADSGGTATSAVSLGTLNSSMTFRIDGSVVTNSTDKLPLDFPGSNFEPGHRDIQDETHLGIGPDINPQITTAFYNFAINRSYGVNAAGQPVFSAITPEQMKRVREIFNIYSKLFGMDFIESDGVNPDTRGMTVVVGDLFPLGGVSGGGTLGIATVGALEDGLAIMDGAQNWNNSFGGSFFDTAIHEIGHLLGLGHSYDLPPGTVMGSESELNGPQEFSFPGDHDIAHGLHLYRRDNRDVDMYSMVIPAGQAGKLQLEVLAERLSTSSNLDSQLSVFKRTSLGVELVAANSASFGQDAKISLDLEAQSSDVTYFISITANGNQDFHPEVENTGSGGFSEGSYQLQVNFESRVAVGPTSFSIEDTDGTPVDGDGDGIAGGNFNFWFRAVAPSDGGARVNARTIFVDKSYTGGVSSGSPAQPMKNLNFSSWPANLRPQPGDVVRVAGPSSGLSPTSIPAYEFGRGGVGNQILTDGLTLQVPRGVTLMADAGAIFKLQGSQITTGSQSAAVDNSNSAFQVLGTPQTPVFFTSYRDESLGIDTNPIGTIPASGDWGGIHFRHKLDKEQGRFGWERHGIFLDYVAGANIKFGGGQVTVLTPSPVVSPIMLSESRPTILNNLISRNADAAISADPNSFEETLFTTPRHQFAESFAPDYSRVGPDVRGNTVFNNSINGLFVRTVTGPGEPLATLAFSAKFDDRDIVHVLSENLIIDSAPGGSVLDTSGPDVSIVQLQTVSGGNMAGAGVRYKLTATDRWGQSSLDSASTIQLAVGAGGAVRLTGLPPALGEFVGRSLWRSTNNGPFQLVAELDRNTTSFTDTGATLAGVLANPNAGELTRGRPNARLEVVPGAIVKLSNARIETSFGAQLIAEGTADRPIIFTSRSDDRFGAGGTFDTFSDGSSTAEAGQWGGLIARHFSELSLDHVLVTYGGGITSLPGGFAGFSAVEVHQSNARIANSRFEKNATGLGGNLSANRDGRGPNAASVVYVMGSQPTIINNIFRDNSITNPAATAAISVNANAMNAVNTIDMGRQTGPSQRVPVTLGNVGPLVRGNALSNNGVNGMVVRGQVLTTESIWDDTDVVHVLQNEIVVPDFHTSGGLTLRSRADESLVVKLSGANAGFTAMGRPTDITDRIGGSLRILGTSGFPVVLTSLSDDTVGAGFDPDGRPIVDTNNDGTSSGNPGNWRSVLFQPYANDRNVATVTELESDQLQDTGTNDVVEAPQNLGSLANRLNGGDENLRLGFSIDGSIAAREDRDVYSFSATAGTMVWLDIDKTSGALDSVIELLDGEGNILAQSVSALSESLGLTARYVSPDSSKILPSQVLGLNSDPFATRSAAAAESTAPITDVANDFLSVNPHDAGMRIILPGTQGEVSNYFVRVRSSNVQSGSDPAGTPALQDPSLLTAGLTTGTYRLQVRLKQANEIAGSVVQFADLRYATNGIEALGMPASSPLLGQIRANTATGATAPGGAAVGNILNSDRGSVSVSGNLTQPTGYDEYTFTIARDSIQSPGNTHVSVTFDVDYADGFGGPNTVLAVYDSTDKLVYIGTNSNIVDDQPAPLRGTDVTDLTRGSAAKRDAYIGPVELPAGDYRVRVTNNRQMTRDMEQFLQASPTGSLVRLEPVNSTQRLAIERFDSVGFETANAGAAINVLFDEGDVSNQLVQWNLSDITTYVVRNSGNVSELVFANAMTGARVADISRFPRVNDVAMSPGGRLVGFQVQTNVPTTDANGGNLLLINSTGTLNSAAIPSGAATQAGTSGIQTFTTAQTGANAFAIQQRIHSGTAPVGDAIVFNALAFHTGDSSQLKMYGVGSRGNGQTSFDLPTFDDNGNINGIDPMVKNYNTTNIVYRLDPDTGAAINNPSFAADREGAARVQGAGTNKIEFGRFLSGTEAGNFTDGIVTGLAQIGDSLYAVSNLGEFFVVTLGPNGETGFDPDFTSADPAELYEGTLPLIEEIIDPETNAPIQFNGLTVGPRNMFGDLLFATTSDGTIYALDTDGNLQPVFPGFSYKTKANAAGADLGTSVEGIDFSPLDVNLWHLSDLRTGEDGHGRPATFDRSQTSDRDGTRSLYFGFRDSGAPTSQQGQWGQLYDGFYDQTYNLPGGAQGAILTNPIDLSNYSSGDLPMLYFNYLLETEGQNNDFQQTNRMRDAFRVYGAGEDGQWILLATNNSPSDQGQVRDGRNGRDDELDNTVNGNFDSLGQFITSQELFDNAQWRQARVPLGALAGKANVRLRFEFSTAATFRTGDPLRGGIELTAKHAHSITDGQGFAMARGEAIDLPAVTFGPGTDARRFEFDLGLVLALPGGASLPSGFGLTLNGTQLNFAQPLDYQLTNTPEQIADVVKVAIQAAGLAGVSVSTHPLHSGLIAIAGLTTFDINGLPAGVIQGTPGVAATWSDPDGTVTLPVAAIPIDFSMDAVAVGEAMRTAFVQEYGDVNMINAFGLDQGTAAWPHHENIVRLYKFLVLNDALFTDNAVGVTELRIGDFFGVDKSGFSDRDEQALNNQFQGIFIDDVIVGFAERGEMVTNGLVAAGNNPFVPNLEYDKTLYDLNQIDTGRYQLNIRTSAEYGRTRTGDLSLALVPPIIFDGRDYDTNDRLSRSLGIEVNTDDPDLGTASAAGRIADGVVFTLTDTKNSLTFEFDVTAGFADPAAGVAQGNIPVPISVAATNEDIAEALRDAINSSSVQNVLGFVANIRAQAEGSAVARNSRIVELHGKAASDLSGGWSFAPETFLTALRWGDDSFFGEDLGDVERERPQGQLILHGNTITDAAQFGIVTSAADRNQPFGQVGDRPYPGAPINFPSSNSQRLAPGVVIANNVLANNTSGGLRVTGDPGLDATVQIARVINNTIYAGIDGILIEGGASPTILNNIIASTVTGVRAEGVHSTVLGANIYQSNGLNVSGVNSSTFDITLGPNEPLFVSTTNRKFYLANGSRAIDASLEALQEPTELTQVKSPLGLPLSPMLAPNRDVNGLLRVDDPQVNSPEGMGGNVFKDRGAVERADFVSPEAVIINPLDNDALLIDADRTVTYIGLEQAELGSFTILLQDINGTGPDASTIVSEAITVTENGKRLREGLDYVFGYNANARILRLTPLAGIWRQDSVYEITLNNQSSSRVTIPNGATLPDGLSLTVTRASQAPVVFEFDNNGDPASGGNVVRYTTGSSTYEIASQLAGLLSAAGIRYLLTSDGSLTIIGQVTSSNPNAVPVVAVGAVRDLAGNLLVPNRATGLTQFTIVMPEVSLDYGDAGSSNIPTVEAGGANGARHAILPVDAGRLVLGWWADADLDGQPTAAVDGDDYGVQVNIGTLGGVVQGTAGPARLTMPAANLVDGQIVAISDGQVTLNFLFDTTGTATGNATQVVVALTPADIASVVAQKFATAVYQAQLQARLSGLVPTASGAEVSLGGSWSHQFDLSGASAVIRVARGDVDLVFPASTASLANGQTMSITDNLGRTVVFELNSTVAAPGNVLVRVNLTTDDSSLVAQALASTIQEQIAAGNLNLGGALLLGAQTVRIIGNDEDGVRIGGLFNAGSTTVPVTIISSGAGMLDAWIDWNGDGDFNDADERLFNGSVPVQAGANNILYVATPAHAVAGLTTARFRLSKSGGLLLGGVGVGGEIEDHLIEIAEGSPPVANADSYSVNEDFTLQVTGIASGVLGNDTDADIPQNQLNPGVNILVHDENTLTPAIDPITNVSNGQLTILRDGTFTYIPNTNFAGTDYFVYRATDGRLLSTVPTTVTITVNPINDAPVFTLPSTTASSLEDQGLVIVNGFLTGILPGPVSAIDEQTQTVTITARALDPSMFTVQPTINSQGQLSYRTAPDVNDLNATDLRVELVLTDDGPVPNGPLHENSSTTTVTVSVEPINDAPSFTLASSTIRIDEDHNGDGLYSSQLALNRVPGPATATDELSQALEFNVVSVSNSELFEAGELPSLTPAGILNFRLAAHRNGSSIVVVELRDDGLGAPAPNTNVSPRQTFTITVNPVNDAPVFTIPGSLTVGEDQGLVSLVNFASGIGPGPGVAVDESSQLVNFVVDSSSVDPSVFAVQPEISPSGTLTFRIADNVNSLSADQDGKSRQFRVRLEDNGPSAPPNRNSSDWVTITVNVTPVNDPPVSPDYETQTNEGTPINILASSILANATGGPTSDEIAQQRVWITQVDSTSIRGGTITPVFNSAGTEIISITYLPPQDAVGIDSFVFVMRDNGIPARQGTASVIINVLSENDPPQFDRGINPVVTEESGPQVISNWATNILPGPISAVDELASQTVHFEVVQYLSGEELFSVSGRPAISNSGTLTFEPALDAAGVAVFVVQAVDDGTPSAGSERATVTVTILGINDPPVFSSGGNVIVDEDSGAYSQAWATNVAPAAGLNANPQRAIDESSQTVSFTIVSNDRTSLFSVQPAISSTGVLSFTPASNAFGSAVVVVQALDNGPSQAPDNNASSLVTFTITFTQDNDAPVANSDSYSIDENSVLNVSAPGVLANDTDVDLPDDQLSAIAGTLQSSFGANVVLNQNGSFTYDPRSVLAIQRMASGQSVIDTFVYTIRDFAGATSIPATVSVTVTGVDDPPVAVDDSFTVGVGQSSALTVLANDTDVDSLINPASVQITRLPIFGTAVVLPTGIVQYTAGAGFIGTDTFGYTVRDMAGNVSNEALVVVGINNPPVANADSTVTFKNEAVVIPVLGNDSDSEGSLDPGSVQVVTPPSSGSTEVLPDGRIRFTPATGFAGVVTFTYTVADNLGLASNEATVTVRVRNSRWQNPSVNLDVNNSGSISAIDALLVINYLNSGQPTFLPDSTFVAPPFIDVNGDERVTAFDALLVINELNRRSGGGGTGGGTGGEGEGEGEVEVANVNAAMMVTPQQMIDTVGRQVALQLQQQRVDELQQTGNLSASTFLEKALPADHSRISESSSSTANSGKAGDVDEDLLSLLSRSSELRDQKAREMVDRCFGEN